MVVLPSSSSTSTPTHLIYPSTLPSIPDQLSVLSYNVLLPNSIDGWWNYKMYHPTTSQDFNIETINKISTWEYRSSLIKNKIEQISPDVVCMQEVSPESFHQDFEFMNELGYDGVEMFRRGRFRPATFWKTQKCTLITDAVHKDRTLLTVFQLNGLEEGHPCFERNWHVLNCHLQAGPEGRRRVRQIDEGVKASVRAAKNLKGCESDPTNPLLVVCGDFNGGSECGAVHYLEDGGVNPDFIEDGEQVTSKIKNSPLANPMIDVATTIVRNQSTENDEDENKNVPPPTLVVAELISQMVKTGSEAYQSPQLSDDLVERLQRCYKKYASLSVASDNGNELVMNKGDVEKWLVDINHQVGRGSEFRTAAKEMGYTEPEEKENNDNDKSEQQEKKKEKPRIFIPENGILTMDGFLNVYRGELRGGKFWGIASDLAVMGEMLPNIGVFEARYDRMYCSTSLQTTALIETISKVPCPNDIEPSDHLPIGASFKLSELN